jgi:DNA-directed RNA polymerase specialized sigma24 family protein
MLEAQAPSSLRVVAELDKPRVKERLHAIARWSTGSDDAAADDLVQDALARVLDPAKAPWDPARGSFLQHMSFVMRHVWDRRMRRVAVQREVLDGNLDETTPGREPSAEDELARLQTLAIYRSALEEALCAIDDKHPLARKIFDLVTQGIEEPAKQARRLKCDVDEVYRTLETVKYHARRALERREVAEARRMRDLQQASKKPPTEETP